MTGNFKDLNSKILASSNYPLTTKWGKLHYNVLAAFDTIG